MTGKQIAATIGISGLSIFAGIGIALLFLQPKAISQTASKDEHSSSKKITREEAEAEIDSALRQDGEVFMREKFLKIWKFLKVWRSEIKTLDDFRLSPSAAEALAEYGTFMRQYYASGENRRSRPPMDEQKMDEAKRAMHVVEKTFPLAAMGCQKALIYLFENGISDVNYIGDGGYLHYAAAAGRTDMIDFLLKCGADINFLDKDGDTPLRWASENQDTKTVYLTVWHLIDRGADLFVGNQRHGLRPDWLLYDSAKYGDLNRMKKLVEEFQVKPKDAEFFSKILKDTASSEIKAYLEREADRRNWEEAWREEERKEKEREREEKRKGKAQPADAAAEGKAQPAALKPESAEAKLLEGQAACRSKDYARAREAFTLVIKERDLPATLRSKAFAGRGTVEFEQNDAELARVSFLHALLLDPNNASAHYYLARIYRSDHFYEAARHEFKRFSEITRNSNPDDARAREVDSTDLPELAKLIETKLAERFGSGGGNAGEAAKLVQEAKALEGKKLFSEAAEKYLAARKADPRSYEAVCGYARRSVNTSEKIKAYCAAIALNPDVRDNYVEVALLARDGGFKIQAVEVLNHAIAHHPQDTNILDLLCGALLKTGNMKMNSAWNEYRQEVIQYKGTSTKRSLPKVPPQKASVIIRGRLIRPQSPEKPATPREDPAEVQRRIEAQKQHQRAMQQQFELDMLQLQRTHELNAQMNQAIMNMGQSMIDPMPIMPAPMPMPRPSRPTGYCSIHKQSYSLPGSCPQCSAPNFGFPTPLDGLLH